MRFRLSEEQVLLKETVEQLVSARAGAGFRRHAESGAAYDHGLWRIMGGELGLAGLTIATEYGGAGAGAVELGAVTEVLGRSLVPSPFFATVALGAAAIMASGDSHAMREYLPRIAAGDATATLAHAEDAHGGGIRTVATRSGGRWTLSGVKHAVVDGATADLIVVSAMHAGAVRLFVVEGRAAEPTPAHALDTTRPIATVRLADASARLLEGEELALPRTLRSASLALAAESLGVAQWCLDTAVAHAQSRVQFGRAIGSFQSIKHKLADMLMDVESSRAAVAYATWAEDADRDDTVAIAALTAASVSDATYRAAAQTLQVLGGIGYTWEHDTHFYFKRAKASTLLLDSAAAHRERALAALGI